MMENRYTCPYCNSEIDMNEFHTYCPYCQHSIGIYDDEE